MKSYSNPHYKHSWDWTLVIIVVLQPLESFFISCWHYFSSICWWQIQMLCNKTFTVKEYWFHCVYISSLCILWNLHSEILLIHFEIFNFLFIFPFCQFATKINKISGLDKITNYQITTFQVNNCFYYETLFRKDPINGYNMVASH